MESVLEIVLIALLAATLFHAIRLERALGVLKRDRSALEQLVGGFNASTRQAEHSIERLRSAADGAGRQIARQVDVATALKDDLVFLAERGERLADRLDALVRPGRQMALEPARSQSPEYEVCDVADDVAEPRLRSQAERDLVKALRLSR
jgi:cell division protein FtsB